MKLSIVAFEAQTGDTVEEQASACLDQLEVYISNASFTLKNIISINSGVGFSVLAGGVKFVIVNGQIMLLDFKDSYEKT